MSAGRGSKFKEHVSLCQLAQRASRCAVIRIARHSLLFPECQRHQVGATRPKSELAVEPEGSRLDRLLVVLTDLVGIDRETGNSSKLVQQMQHLGVDPSGFAFAEGVKRIESDFHPFKE